MSVAPDDIRILREAVSSGTTSFTLGGLNYTRDQLTTELSRRLDRYRSGPFMVYRAHVAILVRQAATDADWEYLTDTLLASLSAHHLRYMRRARQMSDERLAAGWADLVRRLLG